NRNTLHAGPRECLDSAGQLSQELARALGKPVPASAPRDKRDRWGRLLVRRDSYTGRDGRRRSELALRVVTFPAREFTQRRLGRQKEIAALKVVGSGVDASQVGTGKLVTTGRALANRAAVMPHFRALVVAEGRLLGQWRDELTAGAPGRGLPPLAPNAEVLALSEHGSIAGQIRGFDRALGERPGVVLAANSLLDRYPADLQTSRWHVLVADEALRYVNPATDAHRALAQVRFGAVADCWLLTATPRGKSAEHLDVLVGLAVGDEAMIRQRLNTR